MLLYLISNKNNYCKIDIITIIINNSIILKKLSSLLVISIYHAKKMLLSIISSMNKMANKKPGMSQDLSNKLIGSLGI